MCKKNGGSRKAPLFFVRICCASKVEMGQILVFLGRGHGRKGRHQRGLLLENILVEVVDEITFVKANDGSGACISHISLRIRAMVEPIYKLQAVFPQTIRHIIGDGVDGKGAVGAQQYIFHSESSSQQD